MTEMIFSGIWYAIKLIGPLAGTIVLGIITWKVWVHYVQQDFISGITWSMLEIIPPRDVVRSPQAMELFLANGLYHWSEKGGTEQYWQGAVWFWHSLEIASIDGQVHFFIRTPSRIKNLVVTQMYAQYPQCQVQEVEDYTLAVDEISKRSEWNLWGCEFKLRKAEVFPLKTYIDYGLDKDPEEEFKLDPISGVIEFFASLKKGEQAWLQLVVRPSKKEYKVPGAKWWWPHEKKYQYWVGEGERQLLDMLKPFTGQRGKVSNKKEWSTEIRTPAHLNDVVEGAVKKLMKIGFDTGIRIAYVAKKDIFPPGTRTENSRNIRLIWRQYAHPHSNELWRINSAQADFYSGWFLSKRGTIRKLCNRHLNEYRERAFFHLPMRHHVFSKEIWFWPFSMIIDAYPHHHTFVLSVEELATMWHFPGQILRVPALERIESKEAAPPTNLPI